MRPTTLLLTLWLTACLATGCTDSAESEPKSFSSRECTEPENPYSAGTGHSAGFEWAESNVVDSCGGNSQSFVEGCEESCANRRSMRSAKISNQIIVAQRSSEAR
jgi:hypothetical protein